MTAIQTINQTKYNEALEVAKGLIVTDAGSFEKAGEILRHVATVKKEIKAILDPEIEEKHKAHKTAVAERAGWLDPLETAEKNLKTRMAHWQSEQERIAQENARKERERLQKEAEDRRLAEALAAEQVAKEAAQSGDDVGAILAQAQADAALSAPIITAPVRVETAPKVAGVSFRESWGFEIVDFPALVKAVADGKVPALALEPNDKFLGQQARAMKDQLAYPGVRVTCAKTAAARGF